MKTATGCARLAAVAVLITGCASAPVPKVSPEPVVAKVVIEVQPNVNPDARGRPSPVVLKAYELKSFAAFNSADFFSLYDRDKEVLGAEMVVHEEITLHPKDRQESSKSLKPETRYIGVVAAFRDLEHAQWRAAAEVTPGKTSSITIRLDGNKVTIDAR